MKPIVDIAGKTFGRITVLARNGTGPDGKARWSCVCTCGKETVVNGQDLTRGRTNSCGCLRKESSANRNRARATPK